MDVVDVAGVRNPATGVRNPATGILATETDIAHVAAAIGDPSRARVLTALADGGVLPASALAAEAGVSVSTISGHLTRLREAKLLTVEHDGRHRYYRLASTDVARALEELARIARPLPVSSLRGSVRAHALLRARLCYDHLAGRLGVALLATLVDNGVLEHADDSYRIAPGGFKAIEDFGIDTAGFRERAARRLSPALQSGGRIIDVGFTAADDGGFRAAAVSASGRMDIFRYDAVVRCPAGTVEPGRASKTDILQVGPLLGGSLPDAAVSAGPWLDAADFAAHPVNDDPSLGSLPPFTDRRMARLILYQDQRGQSHLRLFDGRPGSHCFSGVTPAEARDAIASDTGFRWGCFLDPGQTARMCINGPSGLTSYGNRHYLQWPGNVKGRFTWVQGNGRPVPSIITVTPVRARTRP